MAGIGSDGASLVLHALENVYIIYIYIYIYMYLSLSLYIYIYIYICICMCMCNRICYMRYIISDANQCPDHSP